MKQLYERTSRTRTASEMDKFTRAAIGAHAEEYQLNNLIPSTLHYFEINSVRIHKPGLLARLTGLNDSDAIFRTLVIVGSNYLVIVISGHKKGINVLSAALDSIVIDAPSSAASIENGFHIRGSWTNDEDFAPFYLGISNDPEGRLIFNTLCLAVRESRQSPGRHRRR
ncbi:hypothetical protein [Streptomyces sp. NPDC048508]|uniref:hypothetical protein n=1 Tax=Streptomyces sp. NPDC048508 TaxID=3365561 RepID=UPI00371CDAB0